MHPISSGIGAFVGGVVAILLLSLLYEWLLRSRIHRLVARHMVAVALAWVTAGLLGGFGFARTGGFTFIAFQIYLLPALLVVLLFYLRSRGRQRSSWYNSV